MNETNQQSLSVTVNEPIGTSPIMNKSDPLLSSNNNSNGTMSSAVAAAAALAASQLNPFYIDKIFNFQNMFLFSGANNSSNNNNNPVPNASTSSSFNSNGPDLKYFNDSLLNSVSNTAAKLASMNHPSELHALFQQNLLHNVYNYYNSNTNNSNLIPPLPPSTSSTFLNNSSSMFIKQEMMPINVNTSFKSSANQNHQGPSAAKKSKNNFSIERILSLPSQTSTNQTQPATIKSENKNKSTNNMNTKFNQFIPNSTNLAKHIGKTPIALTAPLPPQLAALYQSTNHHSLASSSSSSSNTQNSSQQQQQKSIKSSDQVAQTSQQQQQQQPVYKSKNAKKYKCDLCGRGFSRSNTLITHRVSYYCYYLFIYLK